MRGILNSRSFFWLLLALPGLGFLWGFGAGRIGAEELLHPTGEFSVRFMVIAMMIGPLVDLFGSRRWLLWLMRRRRWIGFAAFTYALLHLAFYLVDRVTVAAMLAEFGEPGIWTAWLALVLMAVPGFTSRDAAMRALGQVWKRAQQFAYPAALFTALHWGLLEMKWGGALIHFGPLALLYGLRIAKKRLAPGQPATI